MNTAGIEHRKLDFIQHFLRINEASSLDKFEALLLDERKRYLENQHSTPLTLTQFNESINKAEDDDAHGRMTNAHDLSKQIDVWQ